MKIDICTELHAFVDASKGSYAGCVFARSIVDSRVSVILVRTKSRVAPLKPLSIPRLELMVCCIVKSLSSGPSPLPPDHLTDCAIFEVVGSDIAGPVSKNWRKSNYSTVVIAFSVLQDYGVINDSDTDLSPSPSYPSHRMVVSSLRLKRYEVFSARPIRHRLQQSDPSTRRPLLGLPLTQNHRRLLRQWCDERRMWAAEWNEVVFTDESRICLQHHDGRIRVWRHRGERMLNSCVMHHHTGPAPGIMIEFFPWPARFPDLSPIENMWSMVAQRLIQITPPAATPDQLWQRVEASWSAVPQEPILSLFESMSRRVAAVISNNGGYSVCVWLLILARTTLHRSL
ncbi:transposable element Tcb1 transposase [Trichonephila clavipes]|nr:transposable element Tcb1 transposase [Trichonephila clavipes]